MEEKRDLSRVESREIMVGGNRIFLGEENIIYVTNVGEVDDKTAEGIVEANFKLMSMASGKVDFLIDLNKGGKASPGARKIFKEFSEKDVKGRLAFWGLHPVAKIIATFLMGVIQKKDMCFFNTREEALAWLKDK